MKSFQKGNYVDDKALGQNQDLFRDDNLLIITWLSYTEHLAKLAKKDIEIFSMICVVYNVANCIMELWAQEFLCNRTSIEVASHICWAVHKKTKFF